MAAGWPPGEGAAVPHSEAPVPADEKNLLAGAKVYKENCAVCHGVPDAQKTAIADGMFPKPPQLFKGMGVTDDEAWESYWKVAGGIRMTGMPGFKDHLSETQIWQVAVLVKNADKISPTVKGELTGAAAPAADDPEQPGIRQDGAEGSRCGLIRPTTRGAHSAIMLVRPYAVSPSAGPAEAASLARWSSSGS